MCVCVCACVSDCTCACVVVRVCVWCCESDCVFMRTFVYRHGYDRYYKEKVIYEDIFSVPII